MINIEKKNLVFSPKTYEDNDPVYTTKVKTELRNAIG
jgi:hypothetical protein